MKVDVRKLSSSGESTMVSSTEFHAWSRQVTDVLVSVRTDPTDAGRQRQELDAKVSDLASRTAVFDVDMAVAEERRGALSV